MSVCVFFPLKLEVILQTEVNVSTQKHLKRLFENS